MHNKNFGSKRNWLVGTQNRFNRENFGGSSIYRERIKVQQKAKWIKFWQINHQSPRFLLHHNLKWKIVQFYELFMQSNYNLSHTSVIQGFHIYLCVRMYKILLVNECKWTGLCMCCVYICVCTHVPIACIITCMYVCVLAMHNSKLKVCCKYGTAQRQRCKRTQLFCDLRVRNELRVCVSGMCTCLDFHLP